MCSLEIEAMQKIYSLLRSNKQSGPYTLKELLQLNLKPFDLVWVEGKSAGWSYPSEIDALKMHLPETTKPFEKKETTNDPEPTSSSMAPTSGKPTPTTANTKHIYFSLPPDKQVDTENIRTKAIVESFEESPETKLERKAQELKNKIQAFTEQKNVPKADNDLDTKYSRSLEDIKEEYSSWLCQQRKKKHFPKKFIIPVVAISILTAAVYLILVFSDSKQNITTVLSSQNTGTSLTQSNGNLSRKIPLQKRITKSIRPSKKR